VKLGHTVAVTVACALVCVAASAQTQQQKPPGAGVQRQEPTAPTPTDPLAMSPEMAATIGSDYEAGPGRPEGKTKRHFYGFYEERKGDYRFRTFPPLYFEMTRGLLDPLHPELGQNPDRESLYAMLYYQRRSQKMSADVLFPFFWHVRDDKSYLTAVGPFVHQEGPTGHDNWLAPLFFAGNHEKKDGTHSGYALIPPLLTFSQWTADSAFTLSLPALYFRLRSGSDVDAGVVPFYFHGDNGNTDGARKTYTLVPPLIFYHSSQELEQSSFTVAGPVVTSSSPFRSVFDVVPFVFHIQGKPETGGVREAYTTLFPFFHYGHTDDVSLVATPLFLYRKTHYLGGDSDKNAEKNATTLITPVYSRASTRSGASVIELAGPVVPLWVSYVDKDVDQHTWALLPILFRNKSPTHNDFLTPLFGRFQTYGQSRTYWVFPTLTSMLDTHGYETDFHPIVYVGRHDQTKHTVIAPVYWDFSDPDKRLTIGFPLYWRLADHKDDSVVEVVGNTLYTQKRTAEGKNWSFHFLPFFSYGESPSGYFWNLLMGFAGFEKTAKAKYVKALWFPIKVGGPDVNKVAASFHSMEQ
jgi:hypothetical protein